ncbi:hypothetical protein A176_002854 [Myxococcus hansupus]|uniref:Uncharacterized protein n=1 Tax=Pseudomyxococcus hansupus TaxID=1297742 RepID=A0A0H4XD44_9BACT|nr:hypothetical protein [Myxococcus hansupus]AKQ65942.1 hypothetical protein A176_002854 [Myxococcus hansupus]
MPLPFIPVVIGVAALLGYGGKKSYDGVQAMREAKAIGEEAEELHREWIARLEDARSLLQLKLDALESQRKTVTDTTFRRLFDFLERLEHKARLSALESLGALGVTREEVGRFTAQYLEAGGALSGAVAASLTGAGASAVTTSLVTTFATAGTGTALSGLSGAAANSALLAWLGGGSLATGGFGVAGGAVVLGGIALAPAAVVAGFVIAREGEKAKTKAEEFAAEVERVVAQLQAAVELLGRAGLRVDELREVTAALDLRANRAIDALWALDGTFDPANDEHLRQFATAMQLAKAESELLRVAIFTSEGNINEQAEALLSQQRQFLQESFV